MSPTPPLTKACRRKVASLLRELQDTGRVANADIKPMPSIFKSTYELRVQDEQHWWRIILHTAPDDIVVVAVFQRKQKKPQLI